MLIENYIIYTYIWFLYVDITCPTTIPEVVYNVTTPLCQILHILCLTCLHSIFHMHKLYKLCKLTSINAFLSILAL